VGGGWVVLGAVQSGWCGTAAGDERKIYAATCKADTMKVAQRGNRRSRKLHCDKMRAQMGCF